jgi:hypothetical protein
MPTNPSPITWPEDTLQALKSPLLVARNFHIFLRLPHKIHLANSRGCARLCTVFTI